MSNKINTVDPSFFTQRAENVNREEVYHFNEEKGHSITYFPKFSQIKKDKLVVELIETIQYCKDNKMEYLTNDAHVDQYTGYLIIKYFTSLFDTLSKLSIENNIDYMYELYDNGHFEFFLEDLFSLEEVEKVFNQLKKTKELAMLYKKELDLHKQTIESQVQTKALKEKVLNKLN